MTETPTRALMAGLVLIAVWIGVYWGYEPSQSPRVTISQAELKGQDETVEGVGEDETHQQGTDVGVAQAEAEIDEGIDVEEVGDRGEYVLIEPRFEPERYVVQKGDTSFAAVSQRVYGTERHAYAIASANGFTPDTKLIVGQTRLLIPVDPENVQGKVVWRGDDGSEVEVDEPIAPGLGVDGPVEVGDAADEEDEGGREYVISSRDTLWEIAVREYGSGVHWRKIYEANRDVIKNPDRLPVGKTIVLPVLE